MTPITQPSLEPLCALLGMRSFVVRIKQGKTVVREFDAIARHSMEAAMQFERLCEYEQGQYIVTSPRKEA